MGGDLLTTTLWLLETMEGVEDKGSPTKDAEACPGPSFLHTYHLSITFIISNSQSDL